MLTIEKGLDDEWDQNRFYIFLIRRSTYLAYFKAEWDFIKNLTFLHASQVPPDAAMKKSVLCLISSVKKRDHLSLSLSLEICSAWPYV